VPAVPQGHFQLRGSPAQLKQFQFIDPGVREITIGSDAKFVNGVDFLLNRVPASDKPRTPP
jgi:hypothetical protein